MKPFRSKSRIRRGLAPLELVLSIPLVMMVVSLAVVVGTAACWKIRASVVARNEVWSRRWPRYQPPEPRPPDWPGAAFRGLTNPQLLTEINNPAFQEPVIRGPTLGTVNVNSQLFDPTIRVRIGQSDIIRTPAMLPKLGNYEFRVQHPLLDGKWQYRQMGIRYNTNWRLPTIYIMPGGVGDPDPPEAAAFKRAYQNITGAPFRRDLDVLDRDAELSAWFGGRTDFHPRLQSFCSLDAADVDLRYVQRLLPRIDSDPRPAYPRYDPPGVPERMTRRFLSMYRQQLQILQNTPPPLSAAQQAQMADLQQKINILQDFLATLN